MPDPSETPAVESDQRKPPGDTSAIKAEAPGPPLPPDVLVVVPLRSSVVFPGMVQPSLVVPLVPAGTVRFLERENVLNFSIKKIFRTGRVEWAPELDLFNALNAGTVTAQNRDVSRTVFGQINELISPRILRVGLKFQF